MAAKKVRSPFGPAVLFREMAAALGTQAGVVSGGELSFPSTTTARIAAGTAWVPDGTGALVYAKWAQKDVVG